MEKDRGVIKKAQGVQPGIPPPPDFSINTTFILDPDVAAYVLTVEIQVTSTSNYCVCYADSWRWVPLSLPRSRPYTMPVD